IPAPLAKGAIALFVYAGAEIAVVIEAARILRPDLALGAALGTSIVHLGVVLAIACLSTPKDVRLANGIQIVLLAAVAPLTALFVARNGGFSRLEGGLLLAFFALWMATVLWGVRRSATNLEDSGEEQVAEGRGWMAITFAF